MRKLIYLQKLQYISRKIEFLIENSPNWMFTERERNTFSEEENWEGPSEKSFVGNYSVDSGNWCSDRRIRRAYRRTFSSTPL